MTLSSAGAIRVVRRASSAAYVVAGAGLVALVTIGLFLWVGGPWGTLNDLALLVMTLAIPPLMRAFWELGGLTPTPLALVAQVSGWIAVAVWSAVQALLIVGVLPFDYSGPGHGAIAIESVALIVIGLWVAGANLLAGPWLNQIRWLGVLAGVGFVVFDIGMLVGGADHPLASAGGVGYLIVFPIWALLIARHLAARAS